MKNYQEAIDKADALLLLGQSEVSMYGMEDETPPWHLATSCEPGGSHRFDMATSVRFKGKHEPTGLTFRWTWELEPRSANGSGTYQIDIKGTREVIQQLPPPVAMQFRKYLAECSTKVMTQALDYQKAADNLYADAAMLTGLAGSKQESK